MSGHSKWSSIKHKKGAVDARRGKIFTKLIKEITVAARTGGADPAANPRLRGAIQAAKSENMPKDNIERAIKKGTGELEGVSYEEALYEGYGPGGSAILIESLTDNKNRAVADIRHIINKAGGKIGAAGCVAWMFAKKGYIVVENTAVDEDVLMEAAIDAGAEDVRQDNSNYEIITAVEDFEQVKAAIDKRSISYIAAELTMLPQSTIKLRGQEAEQMVRLMETLEDCEDVQKVYTNADIPEELVGD
ncbi:MAG: YebC/PmpR family DNA-binding transcriptional regulator [Pseudomonadota bacterium]|uniref:Probable transcriptional regulatory protein H8E23_12405 n=1 Tax=Candidatus Desulfatibia profunda TaxID=2841695 RepID=A0A8J6NS18_9BACT|nr:YebC/PmpR family DNA-binding transcriptional regulator [Candidatus Desulfatibia profunda]MBL7181057.1 YebC/PmpR family DNA-binding transcriptional regulator [Desulfobacterales bacterium]MBU0698125.1 YebC/PmpR family DNA-binding transcriptional regulator [Pseudomonadota bacterium]